MRLTRLLFLVLLGTGGAYIFRLYGFEGIYVASESMEPTLPKDRHVMVNKFALFFNKPKHGDIVMFDSPIDPKKGLVKRVIAVGGDTIEIRKKKVVLNGRQIDESYAFFSNPDTLYVGDNIPPLVIPKNCYFVMGDNRDASGDSRDWKTSSGDWMPFLPLSKIHGIVETH